MDTRTALNNVNIIIGFFKKNFVATLVILSLCFFFLGFSYKKQQEYEFHILTLQNKEQTLLKQIEKLSHKKERAEEFLFHVFDKPVINKPIYSLTVTATAYTARTEECDATPEYMASMKPSRIGAIAVSKDLEKKHGLTLGKKVFIKGFGLMRIEDRMNPRIKNRIDILHANLKAAKIFGKKEVTISWIGGET